MAPKAGDRACVRIRAWGVLGSVFHSISGCVPACIGSRNLYPKLFQVHALQPQMQILQNCAYPDAPESQDKCSMCLDRWRPTKSKLPDLRNFTRTLQCTLFPITHASVARGAVQRRAFWHCQIRVCGRKAYPKSPRTQITGFRAQMLRYSWYLGPKALLLGSLDP